MPSTSVPFADVKEAISGLHKIVDAWDVPEAQVIGRGIVPPGYATPKETMFVILRRGNDEVMFTWRYRDAISKTDPDTETTTQVEPAFPQPA